MDLLKYHAVYIKAEIPHTELIDRVQDACRFTLYNQAGIRDWPLQVYAAALIFSPEKSITRLQYQTQQPRWIINKPEVEDHWSPCLQTLEGHRNSVSSACFSHDSKLIASASRDETVKIWDANSGRCLTTFYEHRDIANSISFSHDSKLLASASDDSTINVWETISGQRVMKLEDHDMTMLDDWDKGFSCVAFFQNSTFIASGSCNGNIKLWNTSNGKCFKNLEGHSKPIWEIAFSQHLQLLASASHDGKIKIWDTNSGNCLHTINEHGEIVFSVAFSHDSQLLASGSMDKTIRLWKTSNWNCLMSLNGHGSYVHSVIFSHDSKLLASGSHDHSIKLWDTYSGQCLQTFQGHQYPVKSVVLSHDSQFLASASSDRTIRIWDAKSRQQPRQLDSHGCKSKLYFSHDSSLLASVAEIKDGIPYEIKIWDAQNGQCIQTAEGSRGRTHSLMFSNDLKLFAEHSGDNTVRVWDIKSAKCMQTVTAYQEVKEFFLHNPDLKLFDGTIGLTAFSAYGPNGLTHDASFRPQVYGISRDGRCITRNAECLLWLPPEYRLAPLSGGVYSNSTLCISCSSGRVLFFTFDSAMLSDSLPAGYSVDMFD